MGTRAQKGGPSEASEGMELGGDCREPLLALEPIPMYTYTETQFIQKYYIYIILFISQSLIFTCLRINSLCKANSSGPRS